MKKTHFNEIEVRTCTDDDPVTGCAGIGIHILIDGTVYIDRDHYYVNVESFFEALAQQSAVIEFVGCDYPPCCANGAWTDLSPEAWCWNQSEIRLLWSDVHKAAASMLKVIDEQTARSEVVWCAEKERIPFYRMQLKLLEARMQS